jgi:hypothetical protein
MSLKPESGYETRSMLDETVKMIAHLEHSMLTHVKQEETLLSQIRPLEFQLTEAKQQHAQIKDNIQIIRQSVAQMRAVEQNLRSILSPIKNLPNDVLLQIFQILVQDADRRRDQAAEHFDLLDTEDAHLPLRLSQVCKRWRSIFACNFLLWTTIEADLHPFDDLRQDHRIAHWRRTGEMAQKCLFVYCWAEMTRDILPVLLKNEPLRLVNNQSWKAIKVAVYEDAKGRWDVENERSRQVTIYRNEQTTIRSLIPLMRQASVLTIHGPPPERAGLPWIHLRSLTLKNFAKPQYQGVTPFSFGAIEFTALLDAAPELTNLVLDFTAVEARSNSDDPTPIIHQKLASISLHLRHFVMGKGLFGVQLIAPSLQTLDLLSLSCNSSMEDAPFGTVWDNPKVLSLPPMKDEDVFLAAELCKWLPNVHTLEVTGKNVEIFFTFLRTLARHTTPQSQHPPLPKLSSLFITNTDLTGETLIELLESRTQETRGDAADVPGITEIRMYDSPGVTPVQWHKVQRLLNEAASTE